MSLQTDDIDIRDVRLHMDIGGNGDYYLNLFEIGRTMFNHKGELVEQNDYISLRVSTSGGQAPSEVKLAIAELYRALEKHGLNKHPLVDEGA